MKSIIINNLKILSEIEYSNIDDLYLNCGFKNNKQFICLKTLITPNGRLEFWGKKTKISYKYYDIELYSKCAILLFKDVYCDLTIDEFNNNFIHLLSSNNNIYIDNNIDIDNLIDSNYETHIYTSDED